MDVSANKKNYLLFTIHNYVLFLLGFFFEGGGVGGGCKYQLNIF